MHQLIHNLEGVSFGVTLRGCFAGLAMTDIFYMMFTKLSSFSDLTKILLLGSDPNISEEAKSFLFNIEITDQLQPLIVESGRRNGMLPLLYRNLKSHPRISSSYTEQLKQAVVNGSFVQLKQEAVFREVHAIFEKNNIDYRVLKGLYLAWCVYPEVLLRPMVDIDIMVQPEMVKEANRLLSAHGFTSYAIAEHQFLSDRKHHPYGLKKNGVAVELHRSIFADYDPERIEERLLWNQPVAFKCSGMIAKTLSQEVFLFHLCHHLMGHLRGDFIKLIWCRDIAEFVKMNTKTLDWNFFMALFKMSGAREDLLWGLRFASDFMGAEVPGEIISAITTTPEAIAFEFCWFAGNKKNDRPRPHLLTKFGEVKGWKHKGLFLLMKAFPEPGYILRHYGKKSQIALLFLYPRYLLAFLWRGIRAWKKGLN